MSTATSASSAIREFAAAVRAALSDLSAEDVDELTDGLEADLTEQARDADAQRVDLDDPAAYAAELRAAAGLPVRGSNRTALTERLQSRLTEIRSEILRDFRASPGGSRSLDFLLALRPFWWVLRGWAVYKVIEALLLGSSIFTVLPINVVGWLLFLLLLVVSVQWGRGQWLSRRGLPQLKTIASVGAIVALPFLLMLASMSANSDGGSASAEQYNPQGLLLNGSGVSNVFAYDADGRLLTNVQLFDQEGRPLVTVDESLGENWVTVYGDDGVERTLVASSAVPGRTGWNVFPLRQIDVNDIDYSQYPSGGIEQSDTVQVDPPFGQVQPLAEPPVSALPTPSPIPSEVPTATPPPSPATTPESTAMPAP